ncbi:MAG: hypothetical protein AB1705_15505 [Verrucomicrobiota bacterium]
MKQLRALFQLPGEGEPLDDWFTRGRFAFLLACVFVASFPEVLTGARTFVVRDFGFFGYPLAHYHREAFWRGEIPLWNPLSYCGLPFLAQWNSLVCYPLSLFYLLFPLAWSLPVFCLGHLWLGGVGMYCLAHRWTGSRFAASVAGLAFAFNGLTLNSLMWPNNCAALGWMPWVVWLVERGWREGKREVLLGIFAGAMQMLSGGPEVILLTWAALAAMWCGHCAQGRIARGQLVVRAAEQVILISALCAVQLLPFLQLVSLSHRDISYGDTAWAMPPWGWANFLVPLFYQYESTLGVYFQYDQFWTTSYYVSIGVLLLAVAAVASERRRCVALLAVLAVLSLVLALGKNGFLFEWISKLFPQIGFFRYAVKFVVLTILVVPWLAAFALARHARNKAKPFPKAEAVIAGVFVALIAGLLLFAKEHPQPLDNWPATLQSGLVRVAFLGVTLAALYFLRGAARLRSRWVAGLVLLLSVCLDALTHAPRQNPLAETWIYTPGVALQKHGWNPPPKHGESRVMLSPYADLNLRTMIRGTPQENFAANRLALYANCNLLDDVPKVNGFYSLYPRELYEVVSLLYSATNTYLPKLADFLSVSRITAPGKYFEWIPWNSHLPMATAGQGPVFADRTNTLTGLIDPNFDARAAVFLPPDLKDAVAATRQPDARIVESHFDNHRIELHVQAASPCMVVIAQTYHPAWQATANGERVPVWRANHAFQAVQAPAGMSTIILQYRDRRFHAGAIISLLALVNCLVAWRKYRHGDEPAEPL